MITLTNILSPSDLASLRSSCQVDQTCQFASSSVSATEATPDFTDGFIGRPNTRLVEQPLQERPRSSGGQESKDRDGSGGVRNALNGILKTFYTTYTYFTTLSLDGTSSISTRTEVYSNIKSKGVPVSTLDSNSFAIRPSATKKLEIAPSSSLVSSSEAPSGRLQYSSISRDFPTTTTEAEEVTTEEVTEAATTTTEEVTEEVSETTINPTKSSAAVSDTTLDNNDTLDLIDIRTDTPDLEEFPDYESEAAAEEIEPSTVENAMKTFYTTYTYFTTLFRNGTSFVTSNLETVTNTADATVSPSLVQPRYGHKTSGQNPLFRHILR